MASCCGQVGICGLPRGHAGLCIYLAPDPTAYVRTQHELAATITLLNKELAATIALLDAEVLKRRGAEAALQAFVEGKFHVVPAGNRPS